jgi:hypothetical protein
MILSGGKPTPNSLPAVGSDVRRDPIFVLAHKTRPTVPETQSATNEAL